MVRQQYHLLEIPRANPLLHALLVEELHQGHEACLRDLQFHGFALDGLDFGVRGFLLRRWQRVDVVEDVGALVDAQSGAHFAEHVVLGLAFAFSR